MTGDRLIRVQLEEPKSSPKRGVYARAKEVAPLVTGIGTLLLSIISFYFVHGLDREKEELAVAGLRQTALAAFNEKDAAKREVAAITLAAYGQTALPALRVLLSGSEDAVTSSDMQDFGMRVVKRWMAAGDSKARSMLLEELTTYAKSYSSPLREGAFKSLAGISPGLSPCEDKAVLALLMERFGNGDYPVEADKGIAELACPLLNKFEYTQSRFALRSIAITYLSQQALESYRTVLKRQLSTASCGMLISDLNYVQSSSNGTFQQSVGELVDAARKKCGS